MASMVNFVFYQNNNNKQLVQWQNLKPHLDFISPSIHFLAINMDYKFIHSSSKIYTELMLYTTIPGNNTKTD